MTRQKKVFVFKLADRDRESGQIKLLALTREQIVQVESLFGSTAVYCLVNGIRVKYDFETLVRELGWQDYDVNREINGK